MKHEFLKIKRKECQLVYTFPLTAAIYNSENN